MSLRQLPVPVCQFSAIKLYTTTSTSPVYRCVHKTAIVCPAAQLSQLHTAFTRTWRALRVPVCICISVHAHDCHRMPSCPTLRRSGTCPRVHVHVLSQQAGWMDKVAGMCAARFLRTVSSRHDRRRRSRHDAMHTPVCFRFTSLLGL